MRRAEDLRHNLGLKVLSVALAALLWSFVHGAKVVERELVLPLRCINLADSLALAADPPRAARVLVSGAAQDFVLRRLLPGAELRVDLAHARPPLVRVTPTVTEVAMGGATRLTVVRILEPGVLDLAIEPRAERRLSVRVVLRGEPAPGWKLGAAPRAEPAEVRCIGAASRVELLREVTTAAIDVGGRSDDVRATVDLVPPAAAVVLEPAAVRVHVELLRIGAAATGAAFRAAASLVSGDRAPL
jgi:hypothetical protein